MEKDIRRKTAKERWAVFKDQKTGQELCSYTIRGTFAGERAATIELLSYENNIPQDQIISIVEMR